MFFRNGNKNPVQAHILTFLREILEQERVGKMRGAIFKKLLNDFFMVQPFLFGKSIPYDCVSLLTASHKLWERLPRKALWKECLLFMSSFVRNGQFLSTLGSSSGDYVFTTYRFHSRFKTVLIFSLSLRRLKSSFHVFYYLVLNTFIFNGVQR